MRSSPSLPVNLSSLAPLSRRLLVHAIAAVWFAGQLVYEAGYGLGSAIHQARALLAAAIEVLPAAALSEPAEPPAVEQASIPLGPQSRGIEPLCPGCWWDLIDPSEASEADPELPLRWAV